MTNTYDILLNPPPHKPKVVDNKAHADLLANQQTSGEEKKQSGKKEIKQETNVQANERLPNQASSSKEWRLNKSVSHDGRNDVTTSFLQDVNLKSWQEIIENTETQNSALRLTSVERYAVEDVVNELRRKYGVKTSMNEVARLGLLLLIHDFKQNKNESMIHKVKKA